ncbi:hypothetical protein Efla_006802 [Eimeria flavescens]
MVRAGKTGKGFTPQAAFSPQHESETEFDLILKILVAIESGNQSGCSQPKPGLYSKATSLNYGHNAKLLRLMKNLTARLLEAQPKEPLVFLLQVLEAMKRHLRAKAIITAIGNAAHPQPTRSSQSKLNKSACMKTSESTSGFTERIGYRLGIFVDEDIEVLYNCCQKADAASVEESLERLSLTDTPDLSLAWKVLQKAKNMSCGSAPCSWAFAAAVSCTIEEFFDVEYTL